MAETVMILGASGQVGWHLARLFGEAGYAVVAIDRSQIDFETAEAADVDALIRSVAPSLLINAAAYTHIDNAERNKERAFRINADMPKILAKSAAVCGIPLIHFSTDAVFDGVRGRYGEEDAPRPLSVYGHSKLAGETAVLEQGGTVFRLQWVYDLRGRNFLSTMQRLMREKDTLQIIADQLGAPTAAPDIAWAILSLTPRVLSGDFPVGLYHMAAQGVTSWHGFACAIAAEEKSNVRLIPITSAEYPLPALRPRDGRLYCHKLAAEGIVLPHWRIALAALLQENVLEPA